MSHPSPPRQRCKGRPGQRSRAALKAEGGAGAGDQGAARRRDERRAPRGLQAADQVGTRSLARSLVPPRALSRGPTPPSLPFFLSPSLPSLRLPSAPSVSFSLTHPAGAVNHAPNLLLAPAHAHTCARTHAHSDALSSHTHLRARTRTCRPGQVRGRARAVHALQPEHPPRQPGARNLTSASGPTIRPSRRAAQQCAPVLGGTSKQQHPKRA